MDPPHGSHLLIRKCGLRLPPIPARSFWREGGPAPIRKESPATPFTPVCNTFPVCGPTRLVKREVAHVWPVYQLLGQMKPSPLSPLPIRLFPFFSMEVADVQNGPSLLMSLQNPNGPRLLRPSLGVRWKDCRLDIINQVCLDGPLVCSKVRQAMVIKYAT